MAQEHICLPALQKAADEEEKLPRKTTGNQRAKTLQRESVTSVNKAPGMQENPVHVTFAAVYCTGLRFVFSGKKRTSTAQLDQRALSASYLSLKYLHAGLQCWFTFLSTINEEPVQQATVLSKHP